MKKTLLFFISTILMVSCQKDDDFLPTKTETPQDLQIANSVGLKLQNTFVTDQVSMNVKLEMEGTVTIKIFDISNRVVSKETITVKSGDNLLTVYTNALPSSAYRIGLFDSNNNQLGITDFNKL